MRPLTFASRRRSIALWVLLGIVAAPRPLVGQPKPAPVRGLFWEAKSPTSTVYLLGSIHLGSKAMYPLPAAIEDAFRRSKTLLVEVDLNKVDQAKIGAQVMQIGMYQGGDSLDKHVDAATLKKLKDFCAANGLPLAAISTMKPWLAALTVSILPLQKAGLEAGLGIDKYFLDKAKGVKKVEQIESAEWQIKLLSDIPEKLQSQYLASSLDQAAKFQEVAKTMQDVWTAGDAARMATFVSGSFREPEEVTRRLLEDRNPKMAEAAERCLKGSEPCFMVVGAGHLVGKDGIVALLAKKGYAVRQIPGPAEKQAGGSR